MGYKTIRIKKKKQSHTLFFYEVSVHFLSLQMLDEDVLHEILIMVEKGSWMTSECKHLHHLLRP